MALAAGISLPTIALVAAADPVTAVGNCDVSVAGQAQFETALTDGATASCDPLTITVAAGFSVTSTLMWNEAGELRVIDQGDPSPVLSVTNGGSHRILETGDGFTMRLTGLDRNQATGRLTAGGYAQVSGSGFAPNSQVQVHLFSSPILLGTVTTDANGDFSTSLPLLANTPANTPAGAHTVQAGGFTTDRAVRSLNIGVVVPAVVLLPTSSDTSSLALVALVLARCCSIITFGARRRTS